jgi:signal recognition particle subunit SRP54
MLDELVKKFTAALAALGDHTKIDNAKYQEFIKQVGNALIAADVELPLVMQVQKTLRAKSMATIPEGMSKRRCIEETLRETLWSLLCPKDVPNKLVLKRSQCTVLLMVGLQGNGKTTTVAKMARYYKYVPLFLCTSTHLYISICRNRGYAPGIVCADTFRAGAADQTMQNAVSVRIPYYIDRIQRDPAVVAAEGVARHRHDKRDLIFVDTSGRHAQDASLFEEIKEVAQAIVRSALTFSYFDTLFIISSVATPSCIVCHGCHDGSKRQAARRGLF